MLTDGQRRALRARQLLDSGKDAREVARELGYARVNAMLGAITLCELCLDKKRKAMEEATKTQEKEVQACVAYKEIPGQVHADPPGQDGPPGEPGVPHGAMIPMTRKDHFEAHHYPKTSPVSHLYPIENGIISIRKDQISVTWKPSVSTVFINIHAYKKWMPLYGNLLGGREGLARALRQIAEAATEAAALLEEEEHVDHHAR